MENPYVSDEYRGGITKSETERTGMVLVHEDDLQKVEDFLDYWAKPNKSTPPLNLMVRMAKDLRQRCEYARRGYPAGTLERDKSTGESQERVVNICEVPGCGKPTYFKRCHVHAAS